jgi:undecaprenyl diphosphate synthase
MSTTPAAPDAAIPFDVPPDRRPRHVAIIMDGNGRWAQERGKPRIEGHRAGAESVRRIVRASGRLGIDALTLYSFSSENWKRPADEVEGLMTLYIECLVRERDELVGNDVRFIQIGRREGLPSGVMDEVRAMEEATAHCTGLKLVIALNYGSRGEITDAVRTIARRVQEGALAPDAIDEDTIAAHLYTAGLPDPDLLIRTAGEHRVSNYLLWQISYAEFFVTDICWPDFDEAQLRDAIRAYAARTRRFGGLTK